MKRKSSHKKQIIFVILALIMAVGVLPAQSEPVYAFQGEVPRFEPGSCPFDIPSALTQVRTVNCGYLVVPEFYEKPQGSTIRLGVAILKSRTGGSVPSDPLVMMQGGPGGSTLHDFPQILLTSNLLRITRDIILFDQRGTLYSQPKLNCTEIQDLTLQTLDENLSDAENLRLTLQAMTACRSRLLKEGVDLAAYNTIESAGDVNSLRKALGYNQI